MGKQVNAGEPYYPKNFALNEPATKNQQPYFPLSSPRKFQLFYATQIQTHSSQIIRRGPYG